MKSLLKCISCISAATIVVLRANGQLASGMQVMAEVNRTEAVTGIQYVDGPARKLPVGHISAASDSIKSVIVGTKSYNDIELIDVADELVPVVHDEIGRSANPDGPSWMCRAACFMDFDEVDDSHFVLGDECVTDPSQYGLKVIAA